VIPEEKNLKQQQNKTAATLSLT